MREGVQMKTFKICFTEESIEGEFHSFLITLAQLDPNDHRGHSDRETHSSESESSRVVADFEHKFFLKLIKNWQHESHTAEFRPVSRLFTRSHTGQRKR